MTLRDPEELTLEDLERPLDVLFDERLLGIEVREDGLAGDRRGAEVDGQKVGRALEDLEDDVFRTGKPVSRAALDRASARHHLSPLEAAVLEVRAQGEGLLTVAEYDAGALLESAPGEPPGPRRKPPQYNP